MARLAPGLFLTEYIETRILHVFCRRPLAPPQVVLGRHLLSFALLAHQLQLALNGFYLNRSLLLNASRSLLQFRRELDFTVILQVCAGRNQLQGTIWVAYRFISGMDSPVLQQLHTNASS
jgi:hypothetical protein